MKKFVMGLILGAGLAFTFSAQADEIKSFVGLTVQNELPVTIDGEVIADSGLIINNKGYLPMRAIGEAVGFEVGFDGSTGFSLNKPSKPEVKELSKSEIENKIHHLDIQIRGVTGAVTATEEILKRNPDSQE